MPFVNGIYQPDQSSPLDRLYRFKTRQDQMEKAQMEMEQARQQQALAQQRPGILAEYYTPEQEAIAASGPAAYSPDANPADFAGQLFMRQQAAQEARPASFDRDGAINRLYSIGDLEGAEKLINDQYKGALIGKGGMEKFGTGGDLIRRPDGSIVKRVYSNAGNFKDIPLEGQKAGQYEYVKAGGRTYVKDPFTNELQEVIDDTPTPFQAFQMDPTRQGAVKEAEAAGKERGEAAGKAEAGAETAVATYDKTIGIINELINHPGRKAGTGASSVFNAVPGTQAYDFAKKLEQLSGQNFLTEIQRMKGQGALSDAEGRRLEAAAAALDAGRQEEGFFNELLKLRDEIEFYKKRTQRKAPQGSAPAGRPAASSAPKPGTVKNGYVFMGGNPADPKSWRKR